MNNRILFDKVIDKKRLVVTYDLYNWIVKFGSAKLNRKQFEKSSEHWYFTDLEMMFDHINTLMLKYNLKSLDYGDVIHAIHKSQYFIANLARMLEEKGMENGWNIP
jgi:hypothetical protein